VPCGSLRLWHPDDVSGESVVVVEENLVTAPVRVRIELATGSRQVLRRSQPPGIDPTRYVTERITLPSSGGAQVPVTIARRRDLVAGIGSGCLISAYGALEQPSWPAFSLPVLAARSRAPRPRRRLCRRARARWRGARTAVVGAGPPSSQGPQ
jgi:oligopeptidase B